MRPCYVCGTDMPSEGAVCPGCATADLQLQTMARRADKRRFFFGSVKPPEVVQTPPPKAAPPKRSKVKSPPRQPPAGQAALKPSQQPTTSARDASMGERILNRDPLHASAPASSLHKPSPALPGRLAAHLLDVGLCAILNLMVLGLIIWQTRANFSHLVSYSLLPLLFVLLCFTVLYYWLFHSLFQRSLGHMLLGYHRQPAQRDKNRI